MGMEGAIFSLFFYPRSAKFTQFLVKGVSSVKQIPAELLLQENRGEALSGWKGCLPPKGGV